MSNPPHETRVRIDLTGVPATLLWTLYFRASEARRPDTILPDPKAIELVESIDYPFARQFGSGNPLLAQAQALRVRRFDQQIRRFLTAHPDGTVVALGEGLETQFWRVDNGRVRWLTVDLPESAELRRRLLPESPRQRILSGSALDTSWMEQVDTTNGVLITAQGLLMYLEPPEVHRLLAGCASRFPGEEMLFDAVPSWFGARTMSGKMKSGEGYAPPPMPWSVDAAELKRLRNLPNVADLRELPLPRGRGPLFGYVMPLIKRVPGLRHSPLTIFAPWIILDARFAT